MARAGNRADLLEQAREARAGRARGFGTFLIVAGIALFVVLIGVAMVLDYRDARASGGASSLRLALLGTVAIFGGGVLLVRGRRLRARGAEYELATDERPPILYLRPFEADRASAGMSLRSRTRVRARLSGLAPRRYEQDLAVVLDDVAPFVTIGDPTERLPQLGAARLYADDDEWRATVEDLLARGGTVILHAGDSPGLGWEVERILALGQPERVILSLPLTDPRQKRSREERYADFRSRFGEAFPCGLPEGAGDTRFVFFDADWTPRRLEEAGAPEPAPGSPGEQRALALDKLARAFKRMWAPLWARLLTYCAGVAALIGVLALIGSAGDTADARRAACQENTTPQVAALDKAFGHSATGARRDAVAACRELADQDDLDSDGALADTAHARLHGCALLTHAFLLEIPGSSSIPRGELSEVAGRYCRRIHADSRTGRIQLSGSDSVKLLQAIGAQVDAEQPSP